MYNCILTNSYKSPEGGRAFQGLGEVESPRMLGAEICSWSWVWRALLAVPPPHRALSQPRSCPDTPVMSHLCPRAAQPPPPAFLASWAWLGMASWLAGQGRMGHSLLEGHGLASAMTMVPRCGLQDGKGRRSAPRGPGGSRNPSAAPWSATPDGTCNCLPLVLPECSRSPGMASLTAYLMSELFRCWPICLQ